MLVAFTLFVGFMTAEVDAETEGEQLAERFSPILILTEETGGQWGDSRAGQIDSSTVGVGTSSRVMRIHRKLGMGALWGVVPSYSSGMFLNFGHRQYRGLWRGTRPPVHRGARLSPGGCGRRKSS